MRIAALDLGSNSFHLVVVEVNLDGSFAPLIREREMLRLGDLVARSGMIGERARAQAVEVVRRFRSIADAHRVDEIVALGTSALREASDGADFCDEVEEATGIGIEVVDGVREAQLIFRAVSSSVLIDPGPALCADLGGGSLEVMVGDRGGLSYAASVRLGVGRLTAELINEDPLSKRGRAKLDLRIQRELAPLLTEAREYSPKILIGSSGTLLCLARMAAYVRDKIVPESLNQLTVSQKELSSISEQIFSLPADERAKLPGCDARRAELLPAGMAVLEHLMAESGLDQLMTSEWALREGIVLESIGRHDRAELSNDPRALRLSSVLSLCRRSNWRQPHSRKVAALAGQLFDQTAKMHNFGDHERELLELSALMHDIGEHVSRVDHDRHGAYLIENGGLRGFAPNEVRLLACVARLHIRGTPKESVEQYEVLDGEDRAKAQVLIALLRIADGMDSTHSGITESIRIQMAEPRHVEFVVRARGDADVELWSLRRKKDLFEKVFDVTCDFVLERAGRGEYEVGATGSGLS